MPKKCVIVADEARARFLLFDPNTSAGRSLSEREALVSPELEQPPHERFGQGRSESRSHVRGHWFGLDDHRLGHDLDVERKFASKIAQAGCEMLQEHGLKELILVADPKMLGILRPAMEEATAPHGIEIRSHSREISKFSLEDIESNLRSAGLISDRIVSRVQER